MSMPRNFATVGGATLASRLIGFARDAMLAAVVGTGPVADAFVVAFRLPNLFRRLFAEGAFNSAFVPLFGRTLEEEGEEAARRVAGEIAAALFWTLLALTALAQLFMPAVVWALAPGFAAEPEKFDLTVLMSRIAFPYLLFMSMLAFAAGILNTYHRFAAAAFAPVMLNVVMCAVLAAIAFAGVSDERTLALSLSGGVALAGIVQLVFVLAGLKRLGFRVPVLRPRLTPAVRRLALLGVPGVIAGGITQINIVVGQVIASGEASANALLYYADRLYQLPLGVIGIAVGVVLLPSLTRQLRSGQGATFRKTLNGAMEFSLALTLPASVALVLIPEEIVSVLFQRGAFGREAVEGTALALAAFAWGLPAFVLHKVFAPGFFAREDMRTPMWCAGISAVINLVLSLLLFPDFRHTGIAAATSISGWVNTVLLGLALWRSGYFVPDRLVLRKVALLFVASLLMGAAVELLSGPLAPLLTNGHLSIRLAGLLLLTGSGMATFAVFAQITGGADLIGFTRRLRKGREKGEDGKRDAMPGFMSD